VLLALLVLSLEGPRGADALCDNTCKCANPDPMTIGGTCVDQGTCGNLPCAGDSSCPSTPPASATAIVTGGGSIAIYWEDPTDYSLVDQYNIFYTMTEGAPSCTGQSTGTACAFTVPGQGSDTAGVCGTYNGGSEMFCWLDLIPQLLAVPPCTQTAPEAPTCNYQDLVSGVQIGRQFYFRINAGRCCYGNIVFTAGCTACTDGLQSLNCPKSSTYAYADIVPLGEPTAVRNISASVSGDRQTQVTWALPEDTGSLTSSAGDLTNVSVTRSTASDFSSGNTVFYVASSALSFDDSGLTPGVTYYYKVETGNSACGSAAVCGGSATTNIVAVGVPSAPTSFETSLIAALPAAFDLSWAAPVDTGQGNGAANTVEALINYDVLLDGVVQVTQTTLTHRITGLNIGQTYSIVVRANNQAGNGDQATLSRIGTGYPTAPESLAASVNTADGPLKIRFTWATPSSTGRGPLNQLEEIVGYRLELATGNEVEAGGDWTSSFATFTTELNVTCANTAACPTSHVLTFASARATPHVVRVFAANAIGFGASASTYEQAVDLPNAATALSASVSAPNEIALSWTLPSDTGVGDQTRPLTSVQVDRTFGFENMSCTTNCASCTDSCITSQLGACCTESLAASSTSVTVTGVPASETRYYFRVRTGNDVGFGEASNTTNEQGVSLPSIPTSLAVVYPTALAITFTWAIPADTGVGSCSTDCRPILTYSITVTDDTGTVALSETVASSVFTRTVNSLSHQRTYTIAVRSSNSAGNSATAAELLLIRPRDVPTVPTSFTAAVGNQAYEITLSWGTPTDTGATGTTEPILEYVIEVDTVGDDFTAGDTQILCGTGATCSSPFTVCTCNALSAAVVLTARRATPYYLRIKATNQYGSGAWVIANQYSVGTPSQPRSVTASVVGVRTINVTWAAPEDNGLGSGIDRALVSYIVQRSFNSGTFGSCATGTNANDACASSASGSCCTTTGLSTSTYDVVNVVPYAGPELFYFRVFAENEVGAGIPSSSASEQGVDAPSAPLNLDVATIGPAQFTVTWTSPTNTGVGGTARALLSYRLEVISDPESAFTDSNLYFAADLASNVYTYTKTDFIGGTNYTFRVLASNDAGLGTASATVKVPAIALPGPPTSFTATITGPLVVALQWAIPTDTGFGDATTAPIREYAVNVSSTGLFAGEEEVLFSGTGSDFSYVHTGLVKATGYYYRVFARTDAGWSDPSEAFEQGITVPTEPLALAMAVTSPLKIEVTWQLPADTGTVGTQRPLTKITFVRHRFVERALRVVLDAGLELAALDGVEAAVYPRPRAVHAPEVPRSKLLHLLKVLPSHAGGL